MNSDPHINIHTTGKYQLFNILIDFIAFIQKWNKVPKIQINIYDPKFAKNLTFYFDESIHVIDGKAIIKKTRFMVKYSYENDRNSCCWICNSGQFNFFYKLWSLNKSIKNAHLKNIDHFKINNIIVKYSYIIPKFLF